jgi:ABC-2 type transport system permease protein
MNKFLLKLVMLFSPLWEKLGASIPHLTIILQTKLMMDDRRPNAMMITRGQQQTKKDRKGGSFILFLISFLMGCFYLFVFSLGKDWILPMFVYCAAFMTMLALTLIADFTYVLIDVKDNYILLPKPVNDRTVLLSRLLHILIHVSKIVVPMALPGLIFLAVKAGVAGALAFILLIALLTLFSIFLINALYLVVLHITTPERFKEIINYLQIVFSVAIFAMYYLVPRLVNNATLKDVDLMQKKYLYLTPPMWFAGGWVAVTEGKWSGAYIGLLAAELILPLVSLWLVVRVLAPSFNKRLGMMSGGVAEAPVKAVNQGKRRGYRTLAKWFSKGKTEQMAFEVVWLLTGRSREFKLKVYPSLAYAFIYFAYWILGGGNGKPAQVWQNLPETRMYLVLLYMSCFAFVTAISNLVYSSKYKSAWVYYTAPLEHPGQVLTGAFKSAMVKFFVPYYLVICVFILWIWGPSVIPSLVLALVNITVVCLFFALMFLKKFPFSKELNMQQGNNKWVIGIVMLLVPGFFGGLHYFATYSTPVLYIFIVLSGILAWLIYSHYRDTGWVKIDQAE